MDEEQWNDWHWQLASGGDPLTLSTDRLEYIVAKLHEIPHVEIVRYGTAIPVVMPQRVTDELLNIQYGL